MTTNVKILFHMLVITILLSAVRQTNSAEFIALGEINPAGRFLMDVSDDGDTVIGVASTAYRWTRDTGMVGFESPEPAVGTNRATGLSGDGLVAFVQGDNGHVYKWTEANGYMDIGGLRSDRVETYGWGISHDGSVIVGTSYARATSNGVSSLFDAVRWTESTGMVNLGSLDPERGAEATAVSRNGNVVVGHDTGEAFRWTESTAMVGLGSGTFPVSQAYAVSDDGSIVLGGLQNNLPGDPGTPNDPRAALWTEEKGWTILDDNIMTGARPAAMSGDGSLIAFSQIIPESNGTEAAIFIWTENEGKKLLSDILDNDLGLGSETAGWALDTASLVGAISRDGRFLVGTAQNPNGDFEAFLVDLQIPEPTSGLMLILGITWAVTTRRR